MRVTQSTLLPQQPNAATSVPCFCPGKPMRDTESKVFTGSWACRSSLPGSDQHKRTACTKGPGGTTLSPLGRVRHPGNPDTSQQPLLPALLPLVLPPQKIVSLNVCHIPVFLPPCSQQLKLLTILYNDPQVASLPKGLVSGSPLPTWSNVS